MKFYFKYIKMKPEGFTPGLNIVFIESKKPAPD